VENRLDNLSANGPSFVRNRVTISSFPLRINVANVHSRTNIDAALKRATEHAGEVKASDRLAYKHHNKANLIRKMALGQPKGTRKTTRAHRQKAQDWKAPEIAERTT